MLLLGIYELPASLLLYLGAIIKWSNNQQRERRPPIFGGRGPIAHPGPCKRCVSCSRNLCTAAYHEARGKGLVATTELRAAIDQYSLQFTIQAFPWNLQAFNRLQRSKMVISDTASQCRCHVGRQIPDTSYTLFPRIPSPKLVFMINLIISGFFEPLFSFFQWLLFVPLCGNSLFPWFLQHHLISILLQP